MTPGNVILEVRELIQDTMEPLRYSDEFLLGFVNQTIRRIAILRPDLFAYIDDMECTPNTVIQQAPNDSIRIIEVHSVVDGDSVTEVDKNALDESCPSWVNEEAAPAVNWARHVRNPNKFFIYPKAPEGQRLVIEYARTPKDYLLYEDIDLLPEAYFPVVVDGVVFLAESVDNEHVNAGRAQLFQKSFIDNLGTSAQAKVVTDMDDGGASQRVVRSSTNAQS